MKLLLKLLAYLGVFLISDPLWSHQWVKTYVNSLGVGPEIYYVRRMKEGGAKQGGMLYGVRAGFEHIRRFGLYWGVDGLWARGILNGRVEDEHLRSELTDSNVEGRLGYTFQSQSWRCLSFTPYLGVGYFWEENRYQHPTCIKVHFENIFSYIPVGFLSQIFLTPSLSLGLNFKVRFIVEGKQYVTHDPKYDDMTLSYEERLQYRVELPMTYFFCWDRYSLAASVEPFYEYRCYGHRPNFPFDFLETKLNLYGATLKVFYLF